MLYPQAEDDGAGDIPDGASKQPAPRAPGRIKRKPDKPAAAVAPAAELEDSDCDGAPTAQRRGKPGRMLVCSDEGGDEGGAACGTALAAPVGSKKRAASPPRATVAKVAAPERGRVRGAGVAARAATGFASGSEAASGSDGEAAFGEGAEAAFGEGAEAVDDEDDELPKCESGDEGESSDDEDVELPDELVAALGLDFLEGTAAALRLCMLACSRSSRNRRAGRQPACGERCGGC